MCSNPVRNNFHRKRYRVLMMFHKSRYNCKHFVLYGICLLTTFLSQRCNGCVPVSIFQECFFHARDARFIRELTLSYVCSLPIFFYPSPPPSTTFSSVHFSLPFPLPLSLVCYVTWISSRPSRQRNEATREGQLE